ncbi:MAG: hypothetical protein ABEJ31_05505, partial [Haloarculaceae archaeon]
MSDRDLDELAEELSKKHRLINAWIAAGPEAKTTDVGEVTGASRGYASGIRRALEGEGDEQIDDEELREAYHPELVDRYRSELDEDALDGQWEFESDLQSAAGEAGTGGQSADEVTAQEQRGQPSPSGQGESVPGQAGQPSQAQAGGQPSGPTGDQPTQPTQPPQQASGDPPSGDQAPPGGRGQPTQPTGQSGANPGQQPPGGASGQPAGARQPVQPRPG